jgi:hypothetical protein
MEEAAQLGPVAIKQACAMGMHGVGDYSALALPTLRLQYHLLHGKHILLRQQQSAKAARPLNNLKALKAAM